jgi:hypothetical protein
MNPAVGYVFAKFIAHASGQVQEQYWEWVKANPAEAPIRAPAVALAMEELSVMTRRLMGSDSCQGRAPG